MTTNVLYLNKNCSVTKMKRNLRQSCYLSFKPVKYTQQPIHFNLLKYFLMWKEIVPSMCVLDAFKILHCNLLKNQV